jgi:NodT family efflux transporter outer membrane factor (OMF) lipoprotein
VRPDRTTSHAARRPYVFLWLAISACDVGPKYVPPKLDVPAAFKESSRDAYRGLPPGTWQPARPEDAKLKGKWWETLAQPELNRLEEELDINNQTIAQYFQNFMAARAQVDEARAGYFPTLAVNPSYSAFGGGNGGAFGAGSSGGALGVTATPTGPSGANMSGPSGTSSAAAAGLGAGGGSGAFNYASIPLEASWAPDLFDRVRNTVREFRYAAQVSAADLENERLIEQASLAEYYFELRGQDSLQKLYDRTIEADRRSLDYTRSQFDTGVGLEEAVVQAQVTLESAEATAAGIAINRALYEHAIATLIGKPATSFSMPNGELTAEVPSIPVGIPSELLQRRPDVAAAERTLAQANALIGVGKAAYYPTLTLGASGGVESSSLGTLFSLPAFFWSLGASASETIYDGGLRKATVEQYVAAYKADVAAYRQTVLTAFQQVEDYIATLRVLSQQIVRQAAAVQSAGKYLDIATARYETGLDPYLNVISAETTLLSDEQTLIGLRVSEMMAAVELIQALGGGWDASRLPSPAEVTSKKVETSTNSR